jgi:hypothetical protein
MPEMAATVGKDIGLGEFGLQPAGEEINGQRKTVHLDEEGDDEGGKSAERSPVEPGFRFDEAKGEKDKDGRIDNDQGP